jgi:hypothetical protein
LKRKFEGLEAKTCLILLLPLKMKIVSLEWCKWCNSRSMEEYLNNKFNCKKWTVVR